MSVTRNYSMWFSFSAQPTVRELLIELENAKTAVGEDGKCTVSGYDNQHDGFALTFQIHSPSDETPTK